MSGERYRLDWWRSTWCDQCDITKEEEGSGLPPENYRQVLLHMDGVWALVINDYSERVLAMKVVRQTMNLSMKRAQEALGSRDPEVFRGTKTEIQWLVDLLRNEGVFSARAVVAYR